MTCKLTFSSSSWSIFYKTTSGTGTVRCSNGSSLPVRISAKGGGLTVGKLSRSRVDCLVDGERLAWI